VVVRAGEHAAVDAAGAKAPQYYTRGHYRFF